MSIQPVSRLLMVYAPLLGGITICEHLDACWKRGVASSCARVIGGDYVISFRLIPFRVGNTKTPLLLQSLRSSQYTTCSPNTSHLLLHVVFTFHMGRDCDNETIASVKSTHYQKTDDM